jgi:DNA polymerase III alpha subunit
MSFEDTTDLYETVLFPETYHRFCHLLSSSRPYILEGQVVQESGSITLTVEWLGFLDRYKREVPAHRKKNVMRERM